MTRLHWILAGLALIAAAALTSPPYQMAPMLDGRAVARLNVWTGRVDFCIPDGKTLVCHPGADAWDVVAEVPTP
jgi:hypothetical protein